MRSFNKIMGSFTKTVKKLEELEEKNISKKIAVDYKINTLAEKAEALENEATMAALTAEKIRKFYEVD